MSLALKLFDEISYVSFSKNGPIKLLYQFANVSMVINKHVNFEEIPFHMYEKLRAKPFWWNILLDKGQ